MTHKEKAARCWEVIDECAARSLKVLDTERQTHKAADIIEAAIREAAEEAIEVTAELGARLAIDARKAALEDACKRIKTVRGAYNSREYDNGVRDSLKMIGRMMEANDDAKT